MTSSVSLLRTVCVQKTYFVNNYTAPRVNMPQLSHLIVKTEVVFAATATYITLFRDKVESGFLVQCNLKAFNCHPALAQLYYERFCLAASIHYHLAFMSECTTDEWLYIHPKIISSENGWGSKSQNCTFKGQV